MDSESVFTRFESFNFEADRRFVDGVSSLNRLKDGTENVDLKLFFYNRFVEPIDSGSYLRWRSSSTPSVSDEGTNKASESSVSIETKQLSFSEVMKLVQDGQEVPGVKKLDVQPSNQSPTPPQRPRVLKPWEAAPS